MYSSYAELCRHERHDSDFAILTRRGISSIVVMAPHGGGIEPGTTEIADAISSAGHTFYSFSGLKFAGNARLHITSTRFDEPVAEAAARNASLVVAIHGCSGRKEAVYIGGLATSVRREIAAALVCAGFHVAEREDMPGASPQNICNRCAGGKGVQLELTAALRDKLFDDLSIRGRSRTTPAFGAFTEAVRQALAQVAVDNFSRCRKSGGGI